MITGIQIPYRRFNIFILLYISVATGLYSMYCKLQLQIASRGFPSGEALKPLFSKVSAPRLACLKTLSYRSCWGIRAVLNDLGDRFT